MSQSPRIIHCRCDYYHVIPEGASARIANAVADAALACESIADLCELAARKNPLLKEWAQAENLVVIACHRRAVKWLFERADAALDIDKVRFYNARTGDIDSIIASLTADRDTPSDAPETNCIGQKGQWIPWYPLIDYDRCVNCKQCLNFCLFGVYGLSDDGEVEVVKPRGCKTNCPACARVCQERAIIFPKYADSPINGDEVDEAAIDRQKDKSELEALLGGDIHDIIRKRKAKKLFARPEENTEELSSQQKHSRLARLQKELDIPQEVLDSLSKQPADQEPSDCPNADVCSRDCQKQEGEQRK